MLKYGWYSIFFKDVMVIIEKLVMLKMKGTEEICRKFVVLGAPQHFDIATSLNPNSAPVSHENRVKTE